VRNIIAKARLRRRPIPDPEVDFDGCIEAIADNVVAELRELVPPEMPATEQSRRLVLRATRRLIRIMEKQETEFWPQFLVTNEMRHLVNMIGWYSSLRE
jgi:hypothetical protein